MITLSLNFDGLTGKTARTHEKKVRDIVDTHFGFPGSDKLKMGVAIKDNGSSSVIFAGPRDIVSEAKRLWQENVQPAAERVRSAVSQASASVKKQATPVVKKVKRKVKATVPKKAKAVKVTVAKKTTSKKTKKK